MNLLKRSFFWLLCLSPLGLFAQQPNFFELPDGFYSDHVEVLGSNPAIVANNLFLKSGAKPNGFNPTQEKYFIKIEGELKSVNTDKYFGYARNGIFYWNFKGTFYRLGITGMLSHVVVMQTSFNGSNGQMGPYSTTEQVSVVVDFKSGQSFSFEPEPFEAFLFENDIALYEEFSMLKKRKDKKRALFVFLRRYNEQYKN